MPILTPVDHDPFADKPAEPRLTPVDHDPFAATPDIDEYANTPGLAMPPPSPEEDAYSSALARGVNRITEKVERGMPTPLAPAAPKDSNLWDSGSLKASFKPYIQAARGVVAGSAQLGESVGSGLQYLGGRLGSEALARGGEAVAQRFEKEGRAFAAPKELQGSVWDNPKLLADASWWAYNTAQMAPSLAAAILPGTGAAKVVQVGGKALQLTPQVIARAAAFGQALGAGAAGGAMEGAGTYREVLKQGGSEEEAARAAEVMGLGSAVLNAASFGTMFGKAGGGALARAGKHIAAGLTEGVTEGAEEPWEEYAKSFAHYLGTGEFDPQTWAKMGQAIKERSLNVAGPAALTGGAGSVLSGGEADVQQAPAPGQPAPAIEPRPLPLTDIREVGGERFGLEAPAQQPQAPAVGPTLTPMPEGFEPPFDVDAARYLDTEARAAAPQAEAPGAGDLAGQALARARMLEQPPAVAPAPPAPAEGLEVDLDQQAVARARYLESAQPETVPAPLVGLDRPVPGFGRNLPVPVDQRPQGPALAPEAPYNEARLDRMKAPALRRLGRALGLEDVARMDKPRLVAGILELQEALPGGGGEIQVPQGQGPPADTAPGPGVEPGVEDQTGFTFRKDGTPWPQRRAAERQANRMARETGTPHEAVDVGDGWGVGVVSKLTSAAAPVVHTMPGGETMAGPEHPGAVPGSERAVSPVATATTSVATATPDLQARAEESRKPAIANDERINGVTREEAGRMLANGDPAVLEHIREGVATHGPMQLQDAIRNQAIVEVVEAPAEKREEVKANIAKLRPAVDAALAGKAQEPVAAPAPNIPGAEKAQSGAQEQPTGPPRGMSDEEFTAWYVDAENQGRKDAIAQHEAEIAAIKAGEAPPNELYSAAWRDRGARVKELDGMIAEVKGRGKPDVTQALETYRAMEAKPARPEEQGGEGEGRASRRPNQAPGLPLPEVQEVVEPLTRLAKNAGPTIAVQSVQDMPTRAQRAYRDKASGGRGRIRAFWHEGTTYLLADAITSKADAMTGWMHEQAGHEGLRKLFPSERQFNNALDAVYRSMPRAEQKRIQELYGLGEVALSKRLEAADEYLSKLAERVSLDETLAPQEQGIWTRFVNALRRVWGRVWRKFTGAPLSSEDIAAIVRDSARLVILGKATGEARAVYEKTFGEPVMGVAADEKHTRGAVARQARDARRDSQGRFSRVESREPVTFDAESEARYQEARKGIGDNRPVLTRLGESTLHLVRQFRYLPGLPKTTTFAEARDIIRKFQAAPGIAKDQAIRDLDAITGKLTPAEYDLFTRKLILDDLTFEVSQEHALPFGFTPDTVARDKAAVDRRVNDFPAVGQALAKRAEVLARVKQGLVDSGVMAEEQFKNPAYFRHQVITYAAERVAAQGAGGIRKPRPGYAKKRGGSLEDINANYLEAEFEYLHRAMIDTRAANSIKELSDKYDKRAEAQAQAKKWNEAHPNKEDKRTWRDFLPKGYALWSPETGNVFYTGRPEAERIMVQFMEKVQAEGGMQLTPGAPPQVSREDIAAMMERIGQAEDRQGRLFSLVIPEELATTLDGLVHKNTRGWLDQAFRTPLTYWKRWVLINPRRVLKYNLNNLSGDLDAVIAGSPRALKKLPEAIRELYAVMKGGKPSARYLEALERGVFDTGLTVQEIPEISRLDRFAKLRGKTTIKDMPEKLARGLWRFLKDSTQFRENWLRYAAYLDYAERLESGESMESIGYGAAYKPLVDGLSDSKDKAGLLARELVGDYGAVSEAGQELRAKLFPFYSWLEVNTRRYLRIMSNAFDQGIGQGLKTAGTLGAIKGIKTTAWLGVRTAMLYALVQMWNNLFFPDEEDELDAQARTQLHLTLGRDKDGKVITLRFQGALSDFLGWVGFDDAVGVASEVSKGRATFGELLATVAKAPINKVASLTTPLIRTPVELAAKRTFWPDVFRPRVIPDRGREVARLFSLENEYDWLNDAPTRGYWQSWTQSLVYERDPGENAYNNIQERKRDYMRRVLGREGSGDYSSPRSEALRNLRKSLRYGDKDAEAKARKELRELGVKPKDIRQSIKTQNPLAGLNAADRRKFRATLTSDERKQLEQAMRWYREVYLGRGKAVSPE